MLKLIQIQYFQMETDEFSFQFLKLNQIKKKKKNVRFK